MNFASPNSGLKYSVVRSIACARFRNVEKHFLRTLDEGALDIVQKLKLLGRKALGRKALGRKVLGKRFLLRIAYQTMA